MQQYKFRALRSDLKTNKWVYGSLIITPEGTYILEDGDSVEYNEPEYHSVGMGCGLEDRNITDRYEAMQHGFERAVEKCCELFPPFIPVIPETVGICFGWVDSDNKDIYTGDYLEILWVSDHKSCEIITYSKEYGYFMYGNNPVCELVESQVKSKIIGNIHDSGELLTPSKVAP